MIDGKFVWQQEEDQKEDISIALIFQEQFFTSAALQGHSGWNLIDLLLQDNVPILFINHQQWIDTWRSGFKQETESILFAYCQKKEDHWRSWTYWLLCTTSCTMLAQCKWHRDVVSWIHIDLAIQEGLILHQTRSNAIVPKEHFPACCISKVVRLKTGEVLFEKAYMSPRPPKISLRHDHDWSRGSDELGSAVEQQPVGELVQQSCGEVQHATFSQPTQSNPIQSLIDRGKLMTQKMCLLLKVKRPVPTRSMKKVCTKNLFLQIEQGNLWNCLKTFASCMLTMEQGNLWNQAQAHTVKEQFVLAEHRVIASFNADNEFNRAINEENINFHIPGLPHSAVKQSHGVNVHNLIRRSRTILIDTSKWSSTTSTIQYFQQRITRRD